MSRVVVFDEIGGPEVLHIVDEPVPEPADSEVRVRIEAFAVNPLDVMMRSGTSPGVVPLPHARLGIEAVGTVDALGGHAGAWRVGDPVLVAAVPDAVVRGTYAEFTTLPRSTVVPRPSGLAVDEAAAVWVAFATAYGSLVEMAHVRPADTVLVTAASGAVGRAALQVAEQVGAATLAVTRSAGKTDELLAAGATAVIATDRETIADAVHRHTGGRGADIVLDLVRGPGQRELLLATRAGGTLVAAGYLDPRPTPQQGGGGDVTVLNYRGWDHLLDTDELRRTVAFLDAGVQLGTVRPAIDRILPMDDVGEAHRRFERGDNGGRKIVVRTGQAV